MHVTRRTFLALSMAASAPLAAQQNYQRKPITPVIPAVAGSILDTIERTVGRRQEAGGRRQETMGQTVVCQNVPEASSILRTQEVV